MARTQLSTREIGSVQRDDLDTGTSGQAVVRRLIAGTNISFSSTGADTGTGDVTINAQGGGAGSFGNLKLQSTDQTLLNNYSIVFPYEYYITGTASLTLAGNSIFRII